jgi:hypothetical protein
MTRASILTPAKWFASVFQISSLPLKNRVCIANTRDYLIVVNVEISRKHSLTAISRRYLQSISLRLPLSLLEAIRIEANRRDVSYQSLIKIRLSEVLPQY